MKYYILILLYQLFELTAWKSSNFHRIRGFKRISPSMSLETTTSSNIGTKISQYLVNTMMNSPLYPELVKRARKTMIETANSCGIQWDEKYQQLSNIKDWAADVNAIILENPNLQTPDYYKQKFHAYEEGNLSIQSAIEQEIAGKALGARNFPKDGARGEETLRKSYDDAITTLGALTIPPGGTIVDFGCGTGTSTRRLANLYPSAEKVVGIDLSPYMISVGRFLSNELNSFNIKWVDDIEPDSRIKYMYGDISNTKFSDNSVSLVSICFVLHELPREATKNILQEAFRILKPGGKLCIMEMDPEAPGYVKLRSNPLVFSLVRSTEPWLDEYFDIAPKLSNLLNSIGFPYISIAAATGRHSCIVCTKAGNIDFRPSDNERLAMDQHLTSFNTNISK